MRQKTVSAYPNRRRFPLKRQFLTALFENLLEATSGKPLLNWGVMAIWFTGTIYANYQLLNQSEAELCQA